MTACEQLGVAPSCTGAWQAFLRCAVAQPLDHFECADGEASLRTGYCEDEQGGIAACVARVAPSR